MKKQGSACRTMHIHLPYNAFTNQAGNFWFGVAFGVGVCVTLMSSTR